MTNLQEALKGSVPVTESAESETQQKEPQVSEVKTPDTSRLNELEKTNAELRERISKQETLTKTDLAEMLRSIGQEKNAAGETINYEDVDSFDKFAEVFGDRLTKQFNDMLEQKTGELTKKQEQVVKEATLAQEMARNFDGGYELLGKYLDDTVSTKYRPAIEQFRTRFPSLVNMGFDAFDAYALMVGYEEKQKMRQASGVPQKGSDIKPAHDSPTTAQTEQKVSGFEAKIGDAMLKAKEAQAKRSTESTV